MNIAEIAALANLELDPAEAAGLERDLKSILDYVGQLSAMDTAGVEPMARVPGGDDAQRHDGPLREDTVRPWFTVQEALANAPASAANYFQVPKILERG